MRVSQPGGSADRAGSEPLEVKQQMRNIHD